MLLRKQRIIELIEWCVDVNLSPRNLIWVRKVSHHAATLWAPTEKTIKGYRETMSRMYSEDKWTSVVISSQLLTQQQKSLWLSTHNYDLSSFPKLYPPNLTLASCRNDSLSTGNLKALVFDLWNAFPNIGLKETAEFYDFSYESKKKLLWKYHSEWRVKEGFGKAPKIVKNQPRGIHGAEWQASVPKGLDMEVAQQHNWVKSKNRNGMLFFPKCGGGIGTIFWHKNGHIRLFLHEGYTTESYAKQLFCNGYRDIINDIKVLVGCSDTVHHVGGSLTVNTRTRLPYVKVDNFRKSHGIEITLGDRSHPDSVEIKYSVPDCLKPLSAILNERNDSYVLRLLGKKGWKSNERYYVV